MEEKKEIEDTIDSKEIIINIQENNEQTEKQSQELKDIKLNQIQNENSSEIQMMQPIIIDINDPYAGWGIYEDYNYQMQQQLSQISVESQNKIKAELLQKKKQKKIISEEEFKKYCKERRNKVWYHALWYLVFNVDDHKATKKILYEALKEVTSKSAIDPIPQNKFYFGLSFILRLSLYDNKIIQFDGETLSINKEVGVDLLTDILNEVGPPISERPILKEDEKKKMFSAFLSDDFLDI